MAHGPGPLDLGAFSVSLAVRDLAAARAFYEKLGFRALGDTPEPDWVILKNGAHVLGLFQGMFERNMLTFNPGWTQSAEPTDAFTDVRDIQRRLRAQGIEPVEAADETTTGPAHCLVVDPDGNPILIDQHR